METSTNAVMHREWEQATVTPKEISANLALSATAGCWMLDAGCGRYFKYEEKFASPRLTSLCWPSDQGPLQGRARRKRRLEMSRLPSVWTPRNIFLQCLVGHSGRSLKLWASRWQRRSANEKPLRSRRMLLQRHIGPKPLQYGSYY